MAQSNMTRTVGLALEGGGYRGMYTAGCSTFGWSTV